MTDQDLDYRRRRAEWCRSYTLELLAAAGGSVRRAAGLSGLSAKYLYKTLGRLGMAPGPRRARSLPVRVRHTGVRPPGSGGLR